MNIFIKTKKYLKNTLNLVKGCPSFGEYYKIHISKSKPFNIKQSAFVAQLLNIFLNNFVVGENEIVDPQLCLCIDPFSGTMVSATNKIKYDISQLKKACQEIVIISNNTSFDQTSVAV